MSKPAFREEFSWQGGKPRLRSSRPKLYGIGQYQDLIDSLRNDRFCYSGPRFLEVMPDVSTFKDLEDGFSGVTCRSGLIQQGGVDIRVFPVLRSSESWFHDGFFEGFFQDGDTFKVAFKFNPENDPVEKITALLKDHQIPEHERVVEIEAIVDNIWRMPRVKLAPRGDLLSQEL